MEVIEEVGRSINLSPTTTFFLYLFLKKLEMNPELAHGTMIQVNVDPIVEEKFHTMDETLGKATNSKYRAFLANMLPLMRLVADFSLGLHHLEHCNGHSDYLCALLDLIPDQPTLFRLLLMYILEDANNMESEVPDFSQIPFSYADE